MNEEVNHIIFSRGHGKTTKIIESIPDDIESCFFVVANSVMIPYTKQLITKIKGPEALSKIKVVSVHSEMRGINADCIYWDHLVTDEVYYSNFDEKTQNNISSIIKRASTVAEATDVNW